MPTKSLRALSFLALGLLYPFTTGCLAASGESDEDDAEEVAGDEDVESGEMELGSNLLKNAGFESGWNNWKKQGHHGGALQLIAGSGTYLRTKDPSYAGIAYVEQTLKVSSGKKYHLLVKTRRVSGPGNPEFGVMFFGADGWDLPYAMKFVSAGTSKAWHWRSFDVTAPKGATMARVMLGGFQDEVASGASASASTYDWDGVGMHAF